MRVFNSFQEMLNATVGDVESCAMPSRLDNAARTAMENAGVPTARSRVANQNVSGDLQRITDSVKGWERLLEQEPEQALLELGDNDSEINRAIAMKSKLDIESWIEDVKHKLRQTR